VFDTLGTLVGVSEQARLTVDGRLVRTRQAMLSDAAGTVAGAVLGTSTVTSFIESAAGVEQGGRTGLTAVVTALLFLVALFLAPLVQMIGSYPPITAPALVLVGGMMVGNLRRIEWGDYSEAVPAFLMAMGIPLCYSISDGLTLGFVTYPFIKLVSGRGRQVSWAMYALALLLLAYFIGLRARLG
jgi:AGZA family xanthine/uracil permease-like MFS transporter